jgi:hypothetical protein
MRRSRLVANMLRTALAAIGLLALAGCAATGPIDARPASYAMPGGSATQPSRVGRVYVFRGFGDVFSAGMDTITAKLQEQGVIATAHRHEQWQDIANQIILDRRPQDVIFTYLRKPKVIGADEPLVLIGHSWGADDCIRLADALAKHDIPVDLLITVEAVTPPAVPGNVVRAWNIYKPRPADFLPWWRGVPVQVENPGKTQLTQIDISRDWPAVDHWWLGHSDVDNQPAVQDRIVAMVLAACPPAPPDPSVIAQEQILQQQARALAAPAQTRPASADRQDVPDAR